ncbi:MAG: hypothetical protein CME06_14460 [Gemmatimonadetes bacterium]|nr:hypothetical protein [Gemmatimonadota bacterium]
MFRLALAAASALVVSATTAGASMAVANFLDVPFTTLDKGQETGIVDSGYMVFTEDAEFAPFWNEHAAGLDYLPLMPAIEWENEMVIAAFLGTQYGGTGDIEITQVDVLTSAVFAHVAKQGEISARPIATNPFHIIVTDRWNTPVLFPDFDLNPTTLESGFTQTRLLPDMNVVVDNNADWNQVWGAIHRDDIEAPDVDFSEHLVLALSSGMVPSPGHGIDLAWAKTVDIAGRTFSLAMIENTVPSRPAIMIPGYAWQFVQIDRTGAPLSLFEFTQATE